MLTDEMGTAGWRTPGEAGVDRRRIRPVVWVVSGAVAVLVGVWMAATAVAVATEVGGVGHAPVCDTDFAAGCTTERSAVLRDRGSPRGSWFTGEQEWFVDAPEGAPGRTHGERLSLRVPRQDGREGLTEGAEVTLVYYGHVPAWIRLASGAVLETGGHPRRSAPMLGWMALFAGCSGIFGIQTGVRTRRREGAWRERVPAHAVVGVVGVLAAAGMCGAVGQMVAGGTIWPGVVGALIGTGLGALGRRRSRRREAAYLAER
jgi:hypothetical protein